MNTNNIYSKKHKGSAVVYALVMLTAVLIILSSMIGYVASQIKYSQQSASREESLQIAEAGIYFYRWYLAHEVEGKTAQQIKEFWENDDTLGINTPYEREYKDPYGSGIGRFRITVTPPEDYSTIVIVQSEGWTYQHPESKRTVKVRFRRPSWSEYAVLSNSDVRFGDGTEVFGPIHSNGGVRFDGVIHNLITSTKSTYIDPDSGQTKPGVWTAWSNEYNTNMNSNVFLAGKQYPVSSQDFNGVTADLALMKSAAQSTGTYFDDYKEGRHIKLKTDGTFDIRTVKKYHSHFYNIIQYKGSWSNHPIPDNGVIYVEDNVWLEGKVNNKKVTIVAANLIGGSHPNIFIQHNIEYSHYDGSDIIGIIAQGDIEVIRDSENNLRIDGALLAQTGRVGRKYYSLRHIWWWWTYCPCGQSWCEDHKDTITIYGSIVSNQRYGFAWLDGCPRSTGYTHRNLNYDNNLLYYPPPYFPTGTQYSLDLWDEL